MKGTARERVQVEIRRYRDVRHVLHEFSLSEVRTFPPRHDCPACQDESPGLPAVAIGRVGWDCTLDVVVCPQCGHIYYRNPPSDDFLERFYEEHFGQSDRRQYTSARFFRKREATGSMAQLPVQDSLAKLLHDVAIRPDGCRVLDVGCGYGGLMAGLAEAGYQVFGCELGEVRLQVSQGRFPGRVFTGGLDGVPTDERFDVVYSAHVFEHLRDPAAAFERALGRLRENGIMVLAVPDANHESPVVQALFMPHLHSFREAALQRMGARFGFDCWLWDGAVTGEFVAVFARPDRSPPQSRFRLARGLPTPSPEEVVTRLREPWLRGNGRASLTWYRSKGEGVATYGQLNSSQRRAMPVLRTIESFIRFSKLRQLHFVLTRLKRAVSSATTPIVTTSYLDYTRETIGREGLPVVGYRDQAAFAVK